MYHYDTEMYWKWVNITLGKTRLQVGSHIKDFDAKWVFASQKHKDMQRVIENFTEFPKVYEDDEAVIYKVE
jgi:hypothetical protein